jgi:iron only hydrogenase large subunit-like protein
MLSSSSPAWVKYAEHFYPDKLSLLSSCKSPVQTLATLVKTYYAKQANLKPDQVFTVSITPCTAEKFERTRAEIMLDIYPAVDACLTTKETASLLKGLTGDLILAIPPEEFDPPFDKASGAGDLFGAPGGLLEGMMRTFFELFTKKKLPSIDFKNFRETKGLQELSLKMGKKTIQAAIVHGTGHVEQLMNNIASGEKTYHYVDIKGCPLGCSRGGGEPLPCVTENILIRLRALYDIDRGKTIRKAHENPIVKQMYERVLKKPGAPNSKKLLHTKFVQRERYL